MRKNFTFMKQVGYLVMLFIVFTACTKQKESTQFPNVVLVYIDDLGYGDVSCYGATEITTPNIDKIAENGLMFTNGHCASATCTPSRYAMLTGEYAWRRKGTGIARGNAAMIIGHERYTLADMFKNAGYQTGVVGKWHLGLGPEGGADWNAEIKPGPLELGFDYSFLIPATGDRVPCVYVENHKVVGLDPNDPIGVSFDKKVGDEPTGKENPELLTKMVHSHGHNNTIINGIGRIGWMTGGNAARWVDEDMADVITEKAIDFINRNKEKPFFLYFATHDIHVPRVPHQRFVGSTTMGSRGDAIMQMDWCTGQIMETLEKNGITENTIVIFTSDNGPVIDDGYHDQAVEKLGEHNPSGPLRGGKYSAFDAGTRVPFIVSWPSKIKPGVSDALVSQVDFFHSFAAYTGQQLGEEDAPDSFNTIETFLGKSNESREHLIEHARALSLIKGYWKYIEPKKGAKISRYTNIELGNDTVPQLYNLKEDLGEQENLSQKYPEKTKELAGLLKEIREKGSSRPK